jgi:hypothetical protein
MWFVCRANTTSGAQDEHPRTHSVTLLVTRLHGFRTVLSRIPTGFGPTIWVGELRDDADLPLEPRHEADQVALRVAPELGDLLRALDKVAQRAAGDHLSPETLRRRYQRREARLQARTAAHSASAGVQQAFDGHLEGTPLDAWPSFDR